MLNFYGKNEAHKDSMFFPHFLFSVFEAG